MTAPPRADRRPWTAADVADQTGRTAVITGGNTGIGLAAAAVLAARGATVVLACRDLGRARAAADRIVAGSAAASVETVQLNLASLASVRRAAAELTERFGRLDLLINNAGVMMPPHQVTEDGFELQFGTNHIGHFALTGLVLGSLLAVPGSRVVTVSSNAHRGGRIRFDDLNFTRRYQRTAAYAQSKLANLLFAYELQRRLAAAGAPTISVAAHPGTARTELTRHLASWTQPFMSPRLARLNGRFMQSPEMGALPTLRAATDPAVAGGDYYGPGRAFEMTGPPVLVRSSARSHDAGTAHRLWTESEKLSGVSYPL
jgi:NAD(P)-dependent dehydrogenase (short-subunit alcohol dehydrogenase family)